jgi:hypothetical protein
MGKSTFALISWDGNRKVAVSSPSSSKGVAGEGMVRILNQRRASSITSHMCYTMFAGVSREQKQTAMESELRKLNGTFSQWR